MTVSYLRNILLLLDLFVVLTNASLNVSGEAVTTRFWDCCKPSCGWNGKAAFNRPVLSCHADDKPADIQEGTGCGEGGTAYSCSDQQPWAVNDTFAYGFAGIFLVPRVTDNHIEDAWCCACYQLNFTSDPLQGKTMIVQASNTAYDVTSTNRFSLAMPGGNTTSHDACARQYGVNQNVFGTTDSGVNSKEDCDNLPEALQDGCRFRFDWFKDASYPTASFKRVPCPQVLTDKTQCVRADESAATTVFSPSFLTVAALVFTIAGLLSV